MSTKKILVVALPALLCGALLGYLIPHGDAVAEKPSSQPAKTLSAKGKPVSDEAALERLRARIKALERQLAEKNVPPPPAAVEQKLEPSTSTNQPPAAVAGGNRRWPRSPEEWRAHMEDMRKNQPERYAQMTNHFARMRTHQLERAQGKLDILASVDSNRLSPKQKALHEQYQDLIARQEEVRNIAFAPDDGSVTDEQRRAAHEEMHQVGHQLRELAQAEREMLLAQTAQSFGVKGEAAQELTETIKAVYEATESWGGFGRGGRGHGRGGPPPGPPPTR